MQSLAKDQPMDLVFWCRIWIRCLWRIFFIWGVKWKVGMEKLFCMTFYILIFRGNTFIFLCDLKWTPLSLFKDLLKMLCNGPFSTRRTAGRISVVWNRLIVARPIATVADVRSVFSS